MLDILGGWILLDKFETMKKIHVRIKERIVNLFQVVLYYIRCRETAKEPGTRGSAVL